MNSNSIAKREGRERLGEQERMSKRPQKTFLEDVQPTSDNVKNLTLLSGNKQ